MVTNAQKLIYNISERFYKNGKYGLERISLICRLIFQILQAKKSGELNTLKQINFESKEYFKHIINNEYFELSKIFNDQQIIDIVYLIIELVNNYSQKDIAEAIQQLVNNDSKTSNLIPTDEFSIKIMKAFAKKLGNGYYIDPCFGSGRLLANLNSKSLYGYDINEHCRDIAYTYLQLTENFNDKSNFTMALSTENFLYKDMSTPNLFVSRTFIFDPPLNEHLELYGEMYSTLSANNIYSTNNNIPSEYAFLSKILFNIPNKINTNFICIFANNFLSAQDKFKMTFRRYLMENSLIAVIQSNFAENNKVQKLILVGKNKIDNSENSLRYFITPKDKNISEENISKIVQKCLNNEIFDEKEFYNIAKVKALTLKEIKENNYQISMPQYFDNEINPNEIKSLSDIVEELKETNKELVNTSQFIETLTSNLLDGVKNVQNSADRPNQSLETKQKAWFEENPSDLNTALKIFAKEVSNWKPIKFNYEDNFYYADSADTGLFYLKELYKAKRLRYKNGFLEVYSMEKLSNYVEERKFSQMIIEDNNNRIFIKDMFKNLSNKQINIFNAFIELQFDEQNNFDKYTTSEIHSAVATFKVLGLLNTIPDIDDPYEKYFPYTPILLKEEGTNDI